MTAFRTRTRAAVITAASGLAIAAAPQAPANIVKAQWFFSTWNYQIKHVPDFDQKRIPWPGVPGLPLDGSMFCVPTSAVNLFAYAANHGFPMVEPGDKAWWAYGNPTLYNDATEAIKTMGTLMETNALTGTGGENSLEGAQEWLGPFGFFMDVDLHWFGAALSPSASNLGLLACSGSLVNVCYGYYDQIGSVGPAPILSRDGGHSVSFVKGSWSGSSGVLYVRDPADVPYDAEQSPFVSRKFYATEELVFINNIFNPRVMIRVKNEPSDTSYRLIDGMLSVKPKFGMSWQPDEQPPKLKFHYPAALLGGAGALNQLEIDVNPNWSIEAAQFTALEDGVLVLGNDGNFANLALFNPITGDADTLVELAEGSQMVVAPDGRVYVSGPEKAYCLNPAIDDIVEAEVTPPFPPKGLAYDHNTKLVIAIAPTSKKVILWDATEFEGAPEVLDLPPGIPSQGEAHLALDPTDGGYWFCTDAAPARLFKVMKSAAAPGLINTAVLDVGCPIESLQVDEQGQLIIACDGSVKVYQKVFSPGAPITYALNPASPFHGMPVAGRFLSTISRTNHDPALHDGPAFNNIHPDDLDPIAEFETDCLTDLNDDRTTNSADLNILLLAFGATYLGDTDGDADTDSFDLNMLLADFGQDCPD